MFKFLPHWKHKNIIFLLLGILVAFVFSRSQTFNNLLLHLGNFGYLSAFIAGMLFVSTFTIVTGALILMTLAKTLSPMELILLAGIGAVIGDLLIFLFVKDEVTKEIEPIYEEIAGSHLKKILHTKYFGWTLPVVGAFIIISPLPDELGVSLMGVSKMKINKFLVISWVSHTLGMFFLVSASLIV